MSKMICELKGVRGRVLKIYENKCVIITKATVGSFITGNVFDGEKTIFLKDVVGVQFKESGFSIGYLQFENASIQMNNKDSNFFSENTFTYEAGVNGISNKLMRQVYNYITDRIEELKYNIKIVDNIPDFDLIMKEELMSSIKTEKKDIIKEAEFQSKLENIDKSKYKQQFEQQYDESLFEDENGDNIICNKCGKELFFLKNDEQRICPWCGTKIK